jgi:NSS family neurotransmitter:Na+ symporter
MTIFIVLAGVKNGIEKVSTIMMPILVALAVIVAIYSITRPGAMEGVKYLLVPNFKHFSIMTVVAAMGQMFYSLSVAMGILYTFGSYAKKNMDLETSTTQLEIFDTAIAILAGLMIIPAVFAFSGGSAADLGKGPSLMFITIPKVFASMDFGLFGGIMFFALVLLAALTSSISLLESAVSTFEDEFHWNRKNATIFTSVLMLLLGTLSSLGFNYLSFVSILGMGVLDFFDFITNSVMMPIAAITTVLLILFKVKPETIVKEVESSGQFKRKKIYLFFIKYVAILFLLIILVSSLLDIIGIIKL